MKEIFEMIEWKVLELYLLLRVNMQENGKKVYKKVRVKKLGQINNDMQDNIKEV